MFKFEQLKSLNIDEFLREFYPQEFDWICWYFSKCFKKIPIQVWCPLERLQVLQGCPESPIAEHRSPIEVHRIGFVSIYFEMMSPTKIPI